MSAVDAEAIAEQVRNIVAEAMAMEPSRIRLQSFLMDDLGAESLDYLDIVFRLEGAFSIQITRGEMERAARGNLAEEAFAPGGVISEAGLVRLRELMPDAAHRIVPGLRPIQILSLFTVRTFANMVIAKQEGRSA